MTHDEKRAIAEYEGEWRAIALKAAVDLARKDETIAALEADLAAKDARLAVMREALEYCANTPLSGWTIAQGIARAALAALADQPTGDGR